MAMVDAQTNQLYVYHYDGTGHTVALTNTSQQMVNRYAYSPYGKLMDQVEAIPQPFKYAGQAGIYSEGDNFYYMRARYYNAELSRFISEDPAGFIDGPNLYAYVGGNPIGFVDPLGLDGQASQQSSRYNRAVEIGQMAGTESVALVFDELVKVPKGTSLSPAIGLSVDILKRQPSSDIVTNYLAGLSGVVVTGALGTSVLPIVAGMSAGYGASKGLKNFFDNFIAPTCRGGAACTIADWERKNGIKFE